MSQYHLDAVAAALANDWHGAHQIVQRYEDEYSCWIHAVLHKMEGDAGNARYWYAHTAHRFEEYDDVQAELLAIQTALGG